MKIAITTQGDKLTDLLDPRFGRAQLFMIFDIENNTIEKIINNDANINAQGGAGTSSAQIIAKADASAVISGNFGPNAVKGLQTFGVEMYSTTIDTVENIITKFKKGELTKVTTPTVPGSH